MKTLSRSLLERTGLRDGLHQQINAFRRIRSRLNPSALVKDYVATNPVRKLHIGSGGNFLEGWLNTDLAPRSYRVAMLDATRPFPLEDDSIDYIFSEHMIEHIPYRHGVFMLRECCRVLRPGGVVRIATPDFAFLVDLYRQDKTEIQREYLLWTKEKFPYVEAAEDIFVINNYVRDWAHQFIYDENALRHAFGEAGFRQVIRCTLNQSEHGKLRGLENENRMPPGILKLETLVMEATKSRAV